MKYSKGIGFMLESAHLFLKGWPTNARSDSMTVIRRESLVPYSAASIYDLVNDVARYPDFLPWCAATHIQYQSNEEMKASITVSKGGIEKSFTTHNTLVPHSLIELRLVNGPFSVFHGRWQFQALAEQACKITFELSFEFKKSLMSYAFKKMFEPAANSMMQAFVDRAKHIYG